jgi:nucleoside-diphosphate-sugar epimerase
VSPAGGALKVLFLGGAGMIGSACVSEAVDAGHEVTVVTRSAPKRELPASVTQLRGDVRDAESLRSAVGAVEADVVVNWVGFSPGHLDGHAEVFGGRIQQYVFISTCSVYGRPVPQLPITESSPKRHRDFGYALDKLRCEELLEQAYRTRDFPVTIVRPFHTYDRTRIPVLAGWTAIERMRRGAPVIVQGDGTSLWSLTHSSDFARAFTPLLGNHHAIGEDVNVVSADILTWDQIHLALAAAAGVRDPRLVHRASEQIGREWPNWDAVLADDFRHSMLFDTTKLRRLAPGFAPRVSFSQGARESVAWHDADPTRQVVDAELSAAFDRLAAVA